MARQAKFTLIFAPGTIEHLDRIESTYHGVLRRSINEQLADTATEGTRNRKPLKPTAPFATSWEIRCGPDHRVRVFYDLDLEALEGRVLAIGIKDRNRIPIGGQEYET